MLQLPSELRLKILRFTHRDDEVLCTTNGPEGGGPNSFVDCTAQLSAQALQTCQQFYEEATSILCGESVFSLSIYCQSVDSLSYFDVNEGTSIRVTTLAGYFYASPTSEGAFCNADIDTILQDWTIFAVEGSWRASASIIVTIDIDFEAYEANFSHDFVL